MSLHADALLERRRLRRQLGFWRIAAIGLTAVALLAMFYGLAGSKLMSSSPQIARMQISGVITDDRKQIDLIKRLGKAKHVAGVLVHINSPGGTTTGGEALFEALRETATKKPVVAVFGTMATSAAYIAGLACDHIVARGNTVTGSVGVIFQWAEISQLMEKLGVRFNEVKSGPLKAQPSMFQPLDEAGRKLTEEMVGDAQTWFLGLVANRRKLDPSSIPGLAQGRIFSGRQAVGFKLVDALGSETDAVTWMESTRGVRKGLRIVDWKVGGSTASGFFSSVAQRFLGLSMDGWLQNVADSPHFSALQLDGLVSVWHRPQN